MPELHFHSAIGVIAVSAPAGTRLIDTVRTLSRDGDLPLAWRCAQGTCGACLIHIEHAGSGGTVMLGGMERNVLVRRGALPKDARREQPDTVATPRLACHVIVLHDLLVYIQK
ncbi:2Fe-2S iron-sulfur cluster-binding protein [Jeongeupia naejangsanensis]|uniref:2Fe-2S iron-sulfur cluster binding domain-containing protein n=1 Tax=Jeongeupia naejangsanensis TaxID=613195 RepID=A0ABS2BR28_9NEIS|nr:2Fe-2S iron-sulfur cluster-binding protein [Jeongeupia naejangsanensis]MBM3117518.1 2Fe-2S iron-sulfur cluster binding domain-containing protein [Jeongeupia naejangsanensis]